MTTPMTPFRAAGERVRRAVADRASTDTVLDVRAAVGWTVLTFGLYAFYLFYQLMRRSRDHNRRRVALLLAAEELARQRAVEQDRAEQLRPALEQVRADVQSLRDLDTDARDPMIWLLASFFGSGLVWLVEALVLDQDLIRHERHERAAEAGLTSVFAELGVALPAPVAAAKEPHSYVARIVAVVATLGLYSFWWAADLVREGNANLVEDRAWEDALAAAVTPAPPVGQDAQPTAGDARVGRG